MADLSWEKWSRKVATLMCKAIEVPDDNYEGPDEALRGFYEDGDSPQEVLDYYDEIFRSESPFPEKKPATPKA